VDISLLAKHDFNFQGILGEVLAPKFSFKNVGGIADAYRIAFGFDKKHPAPAFHNRKALEPIEAMRHVIVHRGASSIRSTQGRPV
jgi:hypothetical protein